MNYTRMMVTALKIHGELADRGELSEGKFTDDNVQRHKVILEMAAFDYLAQYAGTFPFLVDMKARANRTGLSIKMIRGVLNCMLQDVELGKKRVAA